MKASFMQGGRYLALVAVFAATSVCRANEATVLVTGGSGLVGSALQEAAATRPDYRWVFLAKEDGDLRSFDATMKIFETHKPTHVVHLAANVGGLFKNMAHKAQIFEDNLLIGYNVLRAAHLAKTKKTISCLSTCIFPAKCEYPIDESVLHNGPPHESNYGYAYAKRNLEIQSRTYAEQYGEDFTCIVPTNIFGPHDNFSLKDGHVIPALIRKCYEAKKTSSEFVVSGSGKPLRQFIYSKDIAKLVLRILESKERIDSVILAPEDEKTIEEVARTIAREMQYEDNTVFDTTQADGQYKKTVSNKKLLQLFPDTKFESFDKAVAETVRWFQQNHGLARL